MPLQFPTFPSKGLTLPFMYSLAQGMNVRVATCTLPDTICGAYDDQTRTILIDRSLNARQERCTLCHELVHAWYGDNMCSNAARNEVRARRICARSLLTEHQVRKAQRIYGDDLWHITVDCDVTIAVLTDWMAMRKGDLVSQK